MPDRSARVLVVEDDRVVSRDIQQQLARLGHVVVAATTRGEDAVGLARELGPDLVLMDIRLAGVLDGIDAARAIRTASRIPVVYLTAYADDQTLRRASATEPAGYLLKPFEDSQLRTAVELALYKHEAERRLRESERRYAITLSSIGDAVIATDEQRRITFVNPVAEALTGWRAADAVGRPLDEVFVVEGGAGPSALRARDGRVVAIDDVGAPIIDDGGRVTGVVLVFRDVTQRRRAEEAEALREVNARISDAVRGSSIGIWEVTADGAVTAWNLLEHLGHPPGGLDRAGWLDLVHPDDRAALGAAIDAALAGTPLEIASRFRGGDGAYRWLLTRGVAVPGRDGRRLVGTSADITDRKRVEDALRRSEHRFRTLVDHATDAFLLYDQDVRVLDVNRQLCDSLGYRPDELVGKTPLDFNPDVTAAELRAMVDRLAAGEVVAFDSRHRRKDGTTFPVEIRARQFRDGGEVRIVSLVRDVTVREHIAAALRQSEARFRGIVASAGAGIALCDLDGRHLQVNPTYAAMVGRGADALAALSVVDVVHADDAAAARAAIAAVGAGAASAACEARCAGAGAPVWVHATMSLLPDAEGRPAHLIVVMQDVSDRKRLEAELRAATAVAEAANRAKDEFLANVSHEIRTPMNAILGMTELVLETPLGDGQRQSLGTARSAAESLLGTINDLLDFSKIEAGKLGLDPTPFALRATVGDTLRALAVRAHRKGLELVCTVAPAVPDALVGDAGRLRQVLVNLVGNAIKFTDEGHVLVAIDVAPGDDGGDVRLRCAVRDTGAGIPRAKQASIFRAFEQEDASTTRRHGGTGLGLTIAARLIGLMDGALAVDSEPGQGSTFTFTARFAAAAAAPPEVVAMPGQRVLVVDGSGLHRDVIAGWLRARGAEPTAVGDAAAAVAALDARGDQRYGAAVVAARAADGALLAALRDRGLDRERVVLLTAGESVAEPAVTALMKPVPEAELVAAVARALAGEPPVTRAPAAPAPVARSPLRVLVAEDNDLNTRLYHALLGRAGHRVTLVDSGRAAVAEAVSGRFDLLLLDLHMPELDGFGVIAALREHERAAGGHLPVIAVTARSRPEDRARCLAAGMDAFLAKPFAAADLAAAIEAAVRAPAELLSRPVLLAACGGDPAILDHICAVLRDRLPVELAAVRAARADAARLREAAHKLCSMVATFSTAMGGVASDLEDHAASGRLDLAAPLVERLEQMAPALTAAVADLSIDRLGG